MGAGKSRPWVDVIEPHTVQLTRKAERSLRSLERTDQQRIRATIELLSDNPRPPHCIALTGENGVYRVRVGDFRILYEVLDEQLIILVIRIGHRRDVYRSLT